MECTHGELCARLADSLGGYNADGLAYVDRVSRRKVHTVAFCAYAMLALAGEYRAALNRLHAGRDYFIALFICDKLVRAEYNLSRFGMHNGSRCVSAKYPVAERLNNAVAVAKLFYEHTLYRALSARAAIVLTDYDVLRDVYKTACKIARVGRSECRICKTLTRAVRRYEKLKNRKSFAEVSPYRHLNYLTRRVGHESAHTRKLTNLVRASARTRVCHHVYRVPLVKALHQRIGNLLGRIFPDLDYGVASALLVVEALHEIVLD